MRILVVEDEAVLAEAVAEALRAEAYAVDLADNGDLADELVSVNEYDLVLLDWSIPGPSGMELLAAWRTAGLAVPVLMLTGRSSVEDRVSGLDRGADDYLTKPFSLVELQARVRSLLRRRAKTLQDRLTAGDLTLDRVTREVRVGDSVLDLAPKEFGALEYLLARVDEVVSRSDLIEHVWDDSFDAMSNVVDVTLYRLRKKVDGGRARPLLQTVRGVGYVLRSARSDEG